MYILQDHPDPYGQPLVCYPLSRPLHFEGLPKHSRLEVPRPNNIVVIFSMTSLTNCFSVYVFEKCTVDNGSARKFEMKYLDFKQ